MEWFPAFKEFLVPVVYVALVSVFWNRFRESPRENAEKNARSGAFLWWGLACFIITAVIILSLVDRDNFTAIFGKTNIWVGIGLAICMIIAGIGIWFKKRWGIAFNLILTPVLLSFAVGLMGIKPGEFIAIIYLLLVSIFFLSDIRSLWNHWNT